MSTLTSLARAAAVASATAQRTCTVRHVHIGPRPLVFIPLALAGEANAPLAAMVGDQPQAPRLLVVPEPRDRDQRFAFAAELAGVILPYIRSYVTAEEPAGTDTRYADAPQFLVPNPAGIAFTRLLGRSTRFRRTEGRYAVPESVPLLGRWLTFFTERTDSPASSLMLAVTDVVAAHWATGQSGVEDRNLGALLGWIDTPPGMSGAQAAAVAEDPVRYPPAGPATDPTFDNEVLDQRMLAVRTARLTGDGRAYQRATTALTGALATQLEPTWAQMWRAITLLRGLPEGAHVRARWDNDKAAFTWHVRHIADGGPPQPRRDGAVSAARRLASLERVQEMVAAGKSTLVVRTAAELADAGELSGGAQTNEQVDDLTDRLAAARPALVVGRLAASEYTPTERVTRHPHVTLSTKLADLAGCPAVLSTAHKWATVHAEATWPWAIVDEAYQMRSDLLLRVAGLFDRALFVGDPGQLDPFSTVQTERWTGLSWDPMQSAVAVLLRHNPEVPVHTLPVSWRLPASAASVVSEAFYPFTGFRAATGPSERRVAFSTVPFGRNALDLTLDTAAAYGWALHELPARHTVRTDAEAVAACAIVAARVMPRGAISYSERSVAGAPVTADRIAVGTAHRDQAQAVRAVLRDGGLPGITVDTANRLQGREFDFVVVLHPLSGRRDATAFHLEADRLCVLATRHRHACIVVARVGIPELLDAHPSTEPVHLNVPVKFPDGWAAHQSLMAHLSQFKVRAP